MRESTIAQADAVTGIAAALDPLQPDEAMVALIEMQAVILADQGITPRTPAFDRIAAYYLALLASRVHIMRQHMLRGHIELQSAHPGTPRA